MRRVAVAVGMAAWFVLAAPAAPAPEDIARAIVERAIRAHGGEAVLARQRADRVQLQGTIYVPQGPTSFSAETLVQLPGQFKNVLRITTRDKREVTVMQLLNQDKVTVLIDGKPQKVDPAVSYELRVKLWLDRAIRLVPLLRDRAFDLAPLEDIKVNDRQASGVRVTVRGRKGPELRLYFDKELSLLVKSEHVLEDGEGKQLREEHYYGNFKEVSGCLRPFKVQAYRGGKKVMEAELTDVKSYDKIDESEFAPP